MVKIVMSTMTMMVTAEDASSLLQFSEQQTAVAHQADARSCVSADVGDVAPVMGSFTANDREAVVVAAGSVAEEAGTFCYTEQDVLLAQRSSGSNTARDLEEALGMKGENETPLKGCEIQFGRGAADPDQIISIVDPTVPALFCDLFNLTSPCTYIHRGGDGKCASPAPPHLCDKYIKVTYSKCDGLKDVKQTMDTAGKFDPATGVFKGCEKFVTSTDATYWAPNKPISETPPPVYPDTYKALKCSKSQEKQADSRVPKGAAQTYIAMNRDCTDPATGCAGGCYQWKGNNDFFSSCMVDKSGAVKVVMLDPVVTPVLGGQLGCKELGFVPLTDGPGFAELGFTTTDPDNCYGGNKSIVSFFTTNQKWFWAQLKGKVDPATDCAKWQKDFPQCY